MPSVVIRKKSFKGYDKAFAQAGKMARERDGWMTPTTDCADNEGRQEYSTWIQEEMEGWQSTDHFSLKYGRRLSELARDVAEANDLEGEQWIGFYEDFLTEFWCQWEEKHNTLKFWQENIQERTIVVFRVWDNLPRDVFALFPCVPSSRDGYQCTSYHHVGQHCGSDYYGCIATSRPATPAEYADLKAELEKIGYVLIVRKRATAEMHRECINNATRK